MKYLTVSHYAALAFKISGELDGKWFTEYILAETKFEGESHSVASIESLPDFLANHENEILNQMKEFDHIINDEVVELISQNEYEGHKIWQ